MSYIKSYGLYVPAFKIQGNVLHPSGRKNEHRIAYVDEDIITMSFEAAQQCLHTVSKKIDAVFFAGNTPVFKNRYHASYLADLLQIPQNILALDFFQTNRSGTDALLMAHQLIKSKEFKNILIVAANQSFPSIGKESEIPFGHAAVALLVSASNGFIKLNHTKSYSVGYAEEFEYKNNTVTYDPRFSRVVGFQTAFKSMLAELNTKNISSFIINSSYAKAAISDLKNAGVNIETQLTNDQVVPSLGYTGAAHALLRFIYAAENKSEHNVLIDYNNGINLIGFSVLENKTVSLNKGSNINTYQDYLIIRKASNFNSYKYKTIDMFSSEMMNEREKNQLINLNGFECAECKTTYLIKSEQCKNCKNKIFLLKKLNTEGKVFTYTKEFYFPASFAPITMVVIDLIGGGRITVQLTDDMFIEQKNKLQIGSKVKLVLRKMLENGNKPNYFYKCIVEP
ncbi:MAG: OB-fold domain-containing protein [Flavobacteriales bacterium]|nr:OB-fold domain-containing protein [Flavobacteriales bacterium]